MSAVGGGRIWLVGAGPGDPELLTQKAVRILQQAEVVLYDALVDERVLELAPRARRIFVGKRRAHHAVPQEVINKLLIRYARRGLAVVRLKAGDPFVFGRGGEEALAAAEAGVLCEVVPGVSSAFAAPLAAHIPVTQRGVAAGCLVITAAPKSAYQSVLPSLAQAPITIVLMMALDARADIADFLLAHNYGADHPTAIVCGATSPSEWCWWGTLGELAAVEVPVGPPGVIVLGATVAWAQTWAAKSATAQGTETEAASAGLAWGELA